MTREEFLGELTKCREYLSVISLSGVIRFKKNHQHYCPITIVCNNLTGKNFSVFEHRDAAKEIGLSTKLAKRIVGAADGNTRGQWSRNMKNVLGFSGRKKTYYS